MTLLQTLLRSIVFSILLSSLIISVAWTEESGNTSAQLQTVGSLQDTVARVNGREIKTAELKRAVDILLATEPETKFSSETLKKITNNMLESLISRELMYQAGMKLEIKDLDEQVREKITREKARYASAADFQKNLNATGLTEKELSDSFLRDVVINNYISKTIDAKISVNEEERKKYYYQNIDKFTQPEQVRVIHILIPTDATMSVDEKKKARDKAEKLRADVLNGRNGIAELAKKYSSAPDGKNGGDLGYLTREQMPESFAQAAFALQPGQLSEVAETRAGYDIIKMRDRRPSVTTPFDKVKLQIEEHLKKQKADTAVQKLLEDARSSSNVEVLLK